MEAWEESLKLMDKARYKEAESLMEGSLKLQKKIISKKDPMISIHFNELQTANSYLSLAYLKQCVGKIDEAEVLYREHLPIQNKYAPDSREYGSALLNFSELLSNKEKFDEAVLICTKAINILKPICGKNEIIAGALSNLAGYLCAQKKHPEALPHCEESYHIFLKLFGKLSQYTKTAFTNYYSVLVESGRLEEARDLETDWKSLHAVDTDKKKDTKISEQQLNAIKRSLEEKLGIERKAPKLDMSDPVKFEKDMMDFIKVVEEEKVKIDPTKSLDTPLKSTKSTKTKSKARKSGTKSKEIPSNSEPDSTKNTDEELLGFEWDSTAKEIEEIEKELKSVDTKVMNSLRQRFHHDLKNSQSRKKNPRKR